VKIDLAKTFMLVRGGLISHERTWNAYFEQTPDWKETATVLAGPLLLANVLLSILFSRLSGGFSYYTLAHGLIVTIFIALVMAAAGLVVAALVFSWMAGVFAGKSDFSRAFAAVSLALIPAWIAGIIGSLIPGFGLVVSLAGGIMTLVFLYKIMPLALAVPQHKRVVHFISSIALIIALQMVIGYIVGTNTVYRA